MKHVYVVLRTYHALILSSSDCFFFIAHTNIRNDNVLRLGIYEYCSTGVLFLQKPMNPLLCLCDVWGSYYLGMKDTAMAGNKPFQISPLKHIVCSQQLLFTFLQLLSCNEHLTLLLKVETAARQINKIRENIIIFVSNIEKHFQFPIQLTVNKPTFLFLFNVYLVGKKENVC